MDIAGRRCRQSGLGPVAPVDLPLHQWVQTRILRKGERDRRQAAFVDAVWSRQLHNGQHVTHTDRDRIGVERPVLVVGRHHHIVTGDPVEVAVADRLVRPTLPRVGRCHCLLGRTVAPVHRPVRHCVESDIGRSYADGKVLPLVDFPRSGQYDVGRHVLHKHRMRVLSFPNTVLVLRPGSHCDRRVAVEEDMPDCTGIAEDSLGIRSVAPINDPLDDRVLTRIAGREPERVQVPLASGRVAAEHKRRPDVDDLDR